jgi:hypothetical protein
MGHDDKWPTYLYYRSVRQEYPSIGFLPLPCMLLCRCWSVFHGKLRRLILPFTFPVQAGTRNRNTSSRTAYQCEPGGVPLLKLSKDLKGTASGAYSPILLPLTGEMISMLLKLPAAAR